MKKTLCTLLIISLLFNCLFPVSADTIVDGVYQHTFSFIDGTGKNNSVALFVYSDTVHVDYYIEGTLVNAVDVTKAESPSGIDREDDLYSVTLFDATSGTTTTSIEAISDYLVDEYTYIDLLGATRSYSYQGRINYNTYYDEFGTSYSEKLSIYQQTGSTTYTYKTINAVQGSVASVIIGLIAEYLLGFLATLGGLASSLFYAAATAAGVEIISGIVQGAISKQYYVRTTAMSVRAIDTSTNRQQTYSAERYQVALSGGGYSSSYYFDGYLPWRSNTVAYWMFCDFWAFSYPGVSSYS